jgi:hypothetical protein
MPADGNETIIRIQPNGIILDQYGHHLLQKAVPVPPHGDLIDRDALKEQLEYVAGLEWNQRVGASPGIECAIDMLDDAQTIIPTDDPKEE